MCSRKECIFTKVKRDEKGQKQREAEKGQREGERNRSQVRVHFDNVTSKHGMHATHHYFRLYRFAFSSFFFFFAAVNAMHYTSIEIVARELLFYLIRLKQCGREIFAKKITIWGLILKEYF